MMQTKKARRHGNVYEQEGCNTLSYESVARKGEEVNMPTLNERRCEEEARRQERAERRRLLLDCGIATVIIWAVLYGVMYMLTAIENAMLAGVL